MSTAASKAVPGELWQHMSCELDTGPAPMAAIGLVTLANDMTIEPELRAFLPSDGVALYANRIPMPEVVNVETLIGMREHIASTTELIVPFSNIDVVAFGCTSGSMAIGPEDSRSKSSRSQTRCSGDQSSVGFGERFANPGLQTHCLADAVHRRDQRSGRGLRLPARFRDRCQRQL